MRLLKEVRNLMENYHAKSGMYHYYRSEYPQAVEFLRKSLKDEESLSKAERRNARHYLTLALIDWAAKLEAKGDPEGGLEQLRAAIEVSPTYPDIHWRLGRLLERMERRTEAAEEYRAAIRLNANYLDAHVSLGFCLLETGDRAAAETAFREALDVRRREVEHPCMRGLDALAEGDRDGAVQWLHQAFLAEPQMSQFYLQRGLDLIAGEEYEKSLVEFDKALEMSPKYPDLHNFRGVVLCELDRIEEAIEAFRQAAALNAEYLVPRLNLAFAYLRAERYKEAEIELESILETDPTEPAAIAKLEELRSGHIPEKRRPVTRGNSR
jgi:tetratricopeptide (TPR) repeat protein